jgi:quercetin dioxygenase-like cupin family protein
MKNTKILRANENEKIQADWGDLTWYASGKLENADQMTVGKCVIKPGCENPLHSHPNCAEVLVVFQGRVAHTVEGGREVMLEAGDTITIPENLPHQARNIGAEDAVLMIAFSSADRQMKAE